MNWYQIFYGVTVADSIKQFFDTTSNIFTFFAVIAFIALVVMKCWEAITVDAQELKNEEEEKVNPAYRSVQRFARFVARLFYPFLILSLLTWAGYVATPTKKDCLFIIAGGAVGTFMSSDTAAKQLPGDVTKFLHMSLQKEISELGEGAKKELGIQTPKDKFLDQAKELTKEQLIQYLESDTTMFR